MMDGSPPLPPEQLRFNVSNSLDVGEFLKAGKRCADELESGVSAVGGTSFLVGAFSIGDAVVAGLCDGWPNALSLTNSPVAMSMQPPSNGVKITSDRWTSK
jgi:hypothetical protein